MSQQMKPQKIQPSPPPPEIACPWGEWDAYIFFPYTTAHFRLVCSSPCIYISIPGSSAALDSEGPPLGRPQISPEEARAEMRSFAKSGGSEKLEDWLGGVGLPRPTPRRRGEWASGRKGCTRILIAWSGQRKGRGGSDFLLPLR